MAKFGQGAYKNPLAVPKAEKKAQRQEFKAAGIKGPALKKEMKGWKREQAWAKVPEATKAMIPEGIQPYVKPKKFIKAVLRGKEPYQAIGRIGGIEAAKELFDYNTPREQLTERALGELASPTTNLREGEGQNPLRDLYTQYMQGASPDVDLGREGAQTMGALGQYARERLAAGGLTPEEEQAIRGRERGAVESGYRESTRAEGGRLAAAGQDPRSGIAAQRALQLQRTRAGGLTDVERGITEQELARKGQIEALTSGVAGMEEQARLGDVGARLRGREGYEGMLGTGAGLEEAGRRFDVTTEQGAEQFNQGLLADLARQRQSEWEWTGETAEGGRQARLAREAYAKAAEAMKPTNEDKAVAVWGGLLGGGVGGGGR